VAHDRARRLRSDGIAQAFTFVYFENRPINSVFSIETLENRPINSSFQAVSPLELVGRFQGDQQIRDRAHGIAAGVVYDTAHCRIQGHGIIGQARHARIMLLGTLIA